MNRLFKRTKDFFGIQRVKSIVSREFNQYADLVIFGTSTGQDSKSIGYEAETGSKPMLIEAIPNIERMGKITGRSFRYIIVDKDLIKMHYYNNSDETVYNICMDICANIYESLEYKYRFMAVMTESRANTFQEMV